MQLKIRRKVGHNKHSRPNLNSENLIQVIGRIVFGSDIQTMGE